MIISVIIPVYNAEKHIIKCLESIVKAKNSIAIEILIIDDGSTDNSKFLCENIAKRYSFIKIVSQKNMGPSVARNKGISIAKGEFIVFVDADDYVEPTYLEELYGSISYNNSDLACCGYLDHSMYGVVYSTNYDKDFFHSANEFLPYVLNKVGGVLWDKIFKREMIINNKISFKTGLNLSEDLLFVLSYLKFTNFISIISSNLYNYNRIDQSGLSKKLDLNHYKNIIKVNDLVLDMLKNFNVSQDLVLGLLNNRKQCFLIQFCYQISLDKSSYKSKIKRIKELRFQEKASDFFSFSELRYFEYPIVYFITSKLYIQVIIYCKLLNFLKNLK